MDAPLIQVDSVSKVYRTPRPLSLRDGIKGLFRHPVDETVAISNLSFGVCRGEIVGYLGPNGAGKSTTIKLLSGIFAPSSGIIRVNNVVPHLNRHANALQMGIMFGQRSQLWWDTPVISSFELLKKMYRIPELIYRQNLSRFEEMLDMGSLWQKPVRQLSLGQRMRCELASVLLHNPPVLYLDEPTIGLDIETKAKMRTLLKAINQEHQTTIFITSHDIGEIERLCSRVLLISQGTAVFDGSLEQLRANFHPRRKLGIRLDQAASEVAIPQMLGIEGCQVQDNWLWLDFDPAVLAPQKLIEDLMKQYDIRDVNLHEVDLETVLLSAYKQIEANAG